MKFAHLLDRVFGTPLLILPAKAETIAAVVLARIGSDVSPDLLLDLSEGPPSAVFRPELSAISYNGLPPGAVVAPAVAPPEASRFIGTRQRMARPYGLARAAEGVALVTVDGSLVNRGAWLDSRSGLTSYEGIGAQIRDAVADPEVGAIVLDVNSPGGEATGMFGLAETIRSARASKPIVAVVNDLAASAAYGIASAANEIVISPTSIVGSIGVVMMHLDRSGELQARGINPTLIFAGEHKVDGHPFGPLSDDVRADLQRSVDTFYARFLETVEAGRGRRTTAEQARATQARTYIGREAIEAGLADRVGTLEQVIAELARRPGPASRSSEARKMEGNPNGPVAGFTQAQVDAARAEGVAEGRTQERTRIGAILSHPAANGREALALQIATTTDLSPDAAGSLLSASPKASTGPAVPPVADRSTGPEIGGSADEPKAEASGALWARAIARQFPGAKAN